MKKDFEIVLSTNSGLHKDKNFIIQTSVEILNKISLISEGKSTTNAGKLTRFIVSAFLLGYRKYKPLFVIM